MDRKLTREEVREIDRYAIERLGVSGLVLMENAGRNAADAIEGYLILHRSDANRLAIVAGGGNNGGDGFVIARHLSMRGFAVTTFVIVPREKIKNSPDAWANLRVAEHFGLDVRFMDEAAVAAGLADELGLYHGIIDAVGGTGIVPPLTGVQLAAVQAINRAADANAEISIFAIDIPTGLDCDSGETNGDAVKADLTISYVSKKAGFANELAKAYTGDVIVANIGIDAQAVIEMISSEK